MKEQSTAKGFAILSAGTVAVKILSLVYIPLLIMIIGDEGYGIFGAAYQVYAFIFVITNSGIPVAISKLVSELNATGNYKDAVKSFKISRFMLIIIGIVMSILIVVIAVPMAKAVKYEKAYLSIMMLAPAVLFTSMASAYRGFFQGNKNMIPTATSQVLEQLANTIFAAIFSIYLMRYGVVIGCAGAPIGTSIGALISAAFLIYYYEKNKAVHPRHMETDHHVERFKTKQLVRKIIYYSLPITLCVGMTYAGNLVDLGNTKARLLVGGFSETNATILYGYLVKYQQLLNVPIALISSLAAAILPALSAAAAVKNRKELQDKINYSLRLCFLISLPCAVGLGVLSTPIYDMLKFRGGAFIMGYGSAVLVFLAVMQIQSTILQGIGKLYIATFFSIIGIVFKVVVNYILIALPGINISGAIIGSIVGYSVPVILNQRMINKTLKCRIKLYKQALKPLISALFMGVMVFATYYILHIGTGLLGNNYFIKAIVTTIAIVSGAYYYLIGLTFTHGIRKSDLNMIPGKLRRLIPNFILEKIL